MRGGLSFATKSSDSTLLLAEYETSANNIENNNNDVGTVGSTNSSNTTNPILAAKHQRGATPGPLTVQNTNLSAVQSTVPGLRLSDLIQEYDFVSVFLYKSTTPITNIYGTFVTSTASPANNPLMTFQYVTTSDVAPVGLQNPTDPFLQYESVLLTKIKMPNGQTQTLFSNEFNGFVMKKSIISVADNVDRVTINGNGWSRLFGSTRRSMKPSLFQNSLYEAGQVLGASDVSALENVYAGRTIPQIIRDLFDLVYRIDFDTSTNTKVTGVTPPANLLNSTNISFSTQKQSDYFASPLGLTGSTTTESLFTAKTSHQLVLGTSFYNITSLIVANAYPANLFNLPQYLLSTVMKLRPFAYIEPLQMPASAEFITAAQQSAAQFATANSSGTALAVNSTNLNTGSFLSVQVPSETFQEAIQNYATAEQVMYYQGTSPVFVEPNLQNLVAYFQFLSDVFQSFSPELQTPYEILDTIRSQAFVEVFEQPSGQFIVRSPQYNNMALSVAGRADIAMVRSSTLNVMSTSYNETVENLITKLFAGYSPNITPISVFQQFGYCDGKLLIQNGLLEMTTAANPNTATASISNTGTNNSKTTGIFGYAEYLMVLSNAKLKTGTITCDLDNTIQVGQTYIDETKFKFGYIVGLSKHVAVAGTATMTLNLSYVRDAVPTYTVGNQIVNINVDLLPVLTDIEESFAPNS
jgi:hypothetical protein